MTTPGSGCREEGLALVRSRYEEQRYIADHLTLYRQLCQACPR